MPKIITVEYHGKGYTINENEVFEVCDAIEDAMTLGEIAVMLQDPRKMKYAKIAKAYTAMLNAVGASADHHVVHREFREAFSDGREGIAAAQAALSGLVNILMDGAEPSTEGDKEPGNETG